MEDITDADYAHLERTCKNFEIKTFRRISWFLYSFVCSFDALLLADAFENFRNACLKIYELGPANFLLAPRLA